MNGLRELYQEMILDHNRNPRNFRKLEGGDGPVCRADGYNPLCGDKVNVYVKLEGDRVKEVSFEGTGCAISTASASMMTQMLEGKSRAEAARLFEAFHAMLTGRSADAGVLGKLAVFERVSEYPARVKCATLAWHTMQAALKGEKQQVSTE